MKKRCRRFTIVKLGKFGKQNHRRRRLAKVHSLRRRVLFMSRFMYDDCVYQGLPTDIQSPLLTQLYLRLNDSSISDDAIQPDSRHHTPNQPNCDAPHHPKMPDASVLVAITNEPTPQVLLTRRAGTLNHHAGEISFVGGKREDSDRHTAHTALREAYEEVRLHPSHVDVIGYLPLHCSKSGLLVRPVVALIDPQAVPTLSPDQSEAEQLLWMPLTTIINTTPTAHRIRHNVGDDTLSLTTPAWTLTTDTDCAPQIVWGLTARILAMMAQIAYDIEHDWYYHIGA